jgi:hypothetical protein
MRWLPVTLTLIALANSCTGTPTDLTASSTVLTASPSPQEPHSRRVSDYASFRAALEADGFVVNRGERTGLPRMVDIPAGRQLFINGVAVSVFRLPTESAFSRLQSSISPEGDELPAKGGGNIIISWERPHFFGAGTLLVLYFGDKHTTLATLECLLGPQFAGPR